MDQIINIGIFAIITFIIIIALYIIVSLLKWVIIEFSNLRLKLHENNTEKLNREIGLARKQQDLRLIKPSEKGLMPIPVDSLDDESTMRWVQDQYKLAYAPPKANIALMDQPKISIPLEANISLFDRWRSNQLPKDGRIWLGQNLETGKDEFTTLHDLHSVLIGGNTGMGKSTFARLVIGQALLNGSKFVIIDPHMEAGEESLASSFVAIQKRLFLPIASNEDEIVKTLNLVYTEVTNRISGKSQDRTPLILVTDETNSLLQRDFVYKALIRVLNIIVPQGRKVFVYAISLGQNFNSSIMDTTVRNGYVSIISFYSRKDVARLISGDSFFADIAASLKIGEIVYRKLNENVRIKVPNVTSHDINLIMSGLAQIEKNKKPAHEYIDDVAYSLSEPIAPHYDENSPSKVRKEVLRNPLPLEVDQGTNGSGSEVAGSGEMSTSKPNWEAVKTADGKRWSKEQIARIKAMLENEISMAEIVKSEWNVTGGNAYQSAAKELRSIIALIVAGKI